MFILNWMRRIWAEPADLNFSFWWRRYTCNTTFIFKIELHPASWGISWIHIHQCPCASEGWCASVFMCTSGIRLQTYESHSVLSSMLMARPKPWFSTQLANRPEDRIKHRRRRSEWLESDALSSLLCRASTHSNASFSPLTGEGVRSKGDFWGSSLCRFQFPFNWFAWKT